MEKLPRKRKHIRTTKTPYECLAAPEELLLKSNKGEVFKNLSLRPKDD
jgi:hypothetical protein